LTSTDSLLASPPFLSGVFTGVALTAADTIISAVSDGDPIVFRFGSAISRTITVCTGAVLSADADADADDDAAVEKEKENDLERALDTNEEDRDGAVGAGEVEEGGVHGAGGVHEVVDEVVEIKGEPGTEEKEKGEGR
jgi:hypothetical protein